MQVVQGGSACCFGEQTPFKQDSHTLQSFSSGHFLGRQEPFSQTSVSLHLMSSQEGGGVHRPFSQKSLSLAQGRPTPQGSRVETQDSLPFRMGKHSSLVPHSGFLGSQGRAQTSLPFHDTQRRSRSQRLVLSQASPSFFFFFFGTQTPSLAMSRGKPALSEVQSPLTMSHFLRQVPSLASRSVRKQSRFNLQL